MAAAKLTPLRRTLLQAVADGEVTYQAQSATWRRNGTRMRGWDGRSLREMRHASHEAPLIQTPESSTPGATVVVQLTDAGRAALAATRGPSTD